MYSVMMRSSIVFFFFFKQKTAYEMRISDWSSDVCSSDLYPEYLQHLDRTPRFLPVQGIPFRRRGVPRDVPVPLCLSAGRAGGARSEERRGGKEGASTCRSRWSPYH